MTTPIAGHLLGKAGFLGGVTLWEGTSRNDLRKVLPASVFEETEAPTQSAAKASAETTRR